MKNINILLVFVLSLFTFCSCENIIDYNIGETEDILVVNSLINSKKLNHVVYLSLSNNKKLKGLEGENAKVELRQNNNVVATCKLEENLATSSKYSFEYQFKENEKYEIVVNCDNFHASSKLEVLPAPILVKVDTFYREAASGGYYDYRSLVGCKVDIKDRENEDNYYRLSAEMEVTVMPEDKSAILEVNTYPVSLYNESDLIMREETDDQEGDIFEMGTFSNSINIFTDNLFKNKQTTLDLDLDRSVFETNGSKVLSKGDGNGAGEGEDDGRRYIEVKLKFYYSNITKEEYKYRKIASILSSGNMQGLFTESYIFPNNIEGGIGFIGISTPSVYELEVYKGIVYYGYYN